MGRRPGSTNVQKTPEWAEGIPANPINTIALALNGPTTHAREAITAEEWETLAQQPGWRPLRVEAWHSWLKLVTTKGPPPHDYRYWSAIYWPVQANGQTVDWRLIWNRPHREPGEDWPPVAAAHDGIVCEALAVSYPAPSAELIAEGLAEVDRFEKANPKAAKLIAKPLAEYRRRLAARS
jgi:hypothetical protein